MCGETDADIAFTSPDRLHDTPGAFSYVRCVRCATTYQNPRVEETDLGLCYPEDYFTHAAVPLGAGADPATWAGRLRGEVRRCADGVTTEHRSSFMLRVVGRIASLVPSIRRRARFGLPDATRVPQAGGRCLELGPGLGHDLIQLTRTGWDAVGLEVDAWSAALAQQTSCRPVHVGTIERADWPDSTFDLIYSSHVFEHLPEPRKAVGAMFRLLTPGGHVVMIYPNSRSLTARLWPEHAVIWDPPRHLVLPPVGAIVDLLQEMGFIKVSATTLARSAAVYAATAREYQTGKRGWTAWTTPPGLACRLIRWMEIGCTAARIHLGEEILVSAERPQAV